MLLAVVEHRVSALDDPLTAEAAASAVRLVALNDLRHDELRAELARLTAARSRIRHDPRSAASRHCRPPPG